MAPFDDDQLFDDDHLPPLNQEVLAGDVELYRSWHLAEHLRNRGKSEELFQLVEEKNYLADQVTALGTFSAARHTLDQLVLPRAHGDRFFRFALTSLSLQRLATRLDDEPTARAILAMGRSELVAGLAEQVTRPLDRARVWAMLAAADPAHDQSDDWRRQVISIVDSFFESPGSTLEPEDCECLATILRELASHLSPAWNRWQKSALLDEGIRATLRASFLEGLWRHGGWLESQGRFEAARHPCPKDLGRILASILTEASDAQLEGATAFLTRWIADDSLPAWQLTLNVGIHLAQRDQSRALAFWRRVSTSRLPSILLDEDAAPLLKALDPATLRQLSDGASLPAEKAYLALALLSQEAQRDHLDAAFRAVDKIEDPLRHFAAILHLAGGADRLDPKLARRWLRAAGKSLESVAYRCDIHLVVLYLEKVATLEPRSLGRELHEVVFAPGFSPAALRELATRIESPVLWRAFFEGVERYSIAVSEHELAAFELRSEILTDLGHGLLKVDGGLERLQELTHRQLLEEEEGLRLDLATQLIQEARPDEAREIIAGLAEGPARRLAEIRLKALTPASQLDAGELFTALFEMASIEDELWGLRALLEVPLDVEEMLERILGRISDPDTRSLFVLALLRHRAAFEKIHFGRLRDARSLLEMARPLLVIEGEAELAALVPELVEVGALAGPKGALAELLESAEGLVRLEELGQEDLLGAFERMVKSACHLGDLRLATSFCDALARLPSLFRPEMQERSEFLRPLVARIVACLERANNLEGSQSLAQRWLAKLGPAWRLSEEPWPALLELCRAPPEARAERIAAWSAAYGQDPRLLAAAVFLVPAAESRTTLELLTRLPAGVVRNRLAFELVAGHSRPLEQHAQILSLIDEQDLQRLARLHSSLAGETANFLEELQDAIAHGLVDTRDPVAQPILRRLWTCGQAIRQEELGAVVVKAFRLGPQSADRALRIWLHTQLAPHLGHEERAKLELWERFLQATRQARRLDYQETDP